MLAVRIVILTVLVSCMSMKKVLLYFHHRLNTSLRSVVINLCRISGRGG